MNYIRVEKPKRPSQLSQCFGAGTGCGWCREYLERLLKEQLEKDSGEPKGSPADSTAEMTLQEYKQGRTRYVLEGGGKPPAGATPIDQVDEDDEK